MEAYPNGIKLIRSDILLAVEIYFKELSAVNIATESLKCLLAFVQTLQIQEMYTPSHSHPFHKQRIISIFIATKNQ